VSIFAPPPMADLPQSVEWYLTRTGNDEGYTLGEIRYGLYDNERVCYTTENEDQRTEEGNGIYNDAAIPALRYKLLLCKSSAGGQCIRIEAVPGFGDVEIRAGSKEKRMRGDILIRTEGFAPGFEGSENPLIEMTNEIRRLNRKNISVYLNVVRK